MQQPFMKIFKSHKHGQILIIIDTVTLSFSVTWKVGDKIFQSNLPGFENAEQLYQLLDDCTRETVENLVDNIKFADEGDIRHEC